jgi:hypothetical protein
MKLPSFKSEPVLTRTAVIGALGWLSSTVLRTDPAVANWLGHNQGTVADVVLYVWPFLAAYLARRHVWPESKVTPSGDGTATVPAVPSTSGVDSIVPPVTPHAVETVMTMGS